MHKRGLSAMITSVALILLSLVAGSLLSYFVFNLGTASLSPAISCTEAQLTAALQIKSACYDAVSHQMQVQIYQDPQSSGISDAVVQLVTGELSEQWTCGTLSCTSCSLPGKGETNTLRLPSNTIPQMVALKVGECVLDSRQPVLC